MTLLLLIPTGLQMAFKIVPHNVFYDSEKGVFDDGVERHSNEYYLLWILGMIGVSLVVGFQIGIVIFLYAFLWKKAELPHWACALWAVVLLTILGTLAHFMNLEYPMGVIQYALGLD
jgi:hypothetical protein